VVLLDEKEELQLGGGRVNGVECYFEPKGVLKKERLHARMITTKDWPLISLPMVRILLHTVCQKTGKTNQIVHQTRLHNKKLYYLKQFQNLNLI
jgi:hypothetical protein